MSFSDMLESLIPDINWNIAVNGDVRHILTQDKVGFYTELTLSEARTKVRDVFKLATPSTINSLTVALCEDSDRVIDLARFRESRGKVIGFKDACFDLQTGKIRAYSSTDFCLNPLPHRLNYAEYKDEDDDWFVGVLASWVGEDCADWLCNVIAYFLFIHPNEEQVWLNLFGMGSNGKSLCLEIFSKILGEEKVIGCDLSHINQFSTASFQGKWLVIGRDSSTYVSETVTGLIKAYTGEKRGLIERKGGLSFDDDIDGKLIISTNTLIHSKDRTFGWFRRIIPVPFPNQFEKDRKFERMILSKIPVILRVLLHRAYCYAVNDISFKKYMPLSVQELITETRYSNDKVSHYWESMFFYEPTRQGVREPNFETMRFWNGKRMSELYFDYCQWYDRMYGDGAPEPGMKGFGGQYGAFMAVSKDFFRWKRSNTGSTIELIRQK
jgi:phage/plasmid-associated DNA primase